MSHKDKHNNGINKINNDINIVYNFKKQVIIVFLESGRGNINNTW